MIRRLFKILAWSAGILALLAGAGLWALDWYLGTADFKHRVENLFYRGTGYVLEIHEDLGVTVYPWLGVEAVGVVLRHENGGEALAAATQVSAAVDVPSLLDHHLDLNTLVFRQLEVNVHFDAAGRTGWEGLLEMAGVSGVGGADGRVSDIRRLRARNFVVRGLQMEDSEFHYADERSGQSLIVSNVDLHTGAFEPGRPLSVDLAGHVDLRHPALGATVRLIGDVQADLAKNSARLDGAVLDLELSGLPGHPDVPLQAAGRLSLDSAAATARLDNLHATWAGLTLAGALEAEDLYGRPQVQGSLALERFAVREAFNGFHKGLIPDADPGIFGPGRLSADVKATLDRVELTNLHAGMDDSQAAGRIAWVPGDKPSVSWDLTLDHIDFDRYYKLFTTPEDFYLADFFPDLPLDAVLSGRLRVGRMTVGGAPVEGVDLRLDSGDGAVRLDMPQAKVAGGGVTARLEATVERDGAVYPLALSGQLRFTGADAAGLPFGSGKDWELTGKGDADIGVSLPRTPFARQRIIDDVLRLASLKAAYRLRPGTLRVAGKDGKRTVVQYKSLALNATIKGAGQGGGHDDFAFAANAALDLDAAPDGWALSGKLGGRLLLDFGLGRLRLERTALGVQYKGKGLPAADAVAVLTADADFDLDAERLSLADLTAEATGAKAGGQLRGEKIFSDDRVVTGRLAASAANLARVLRTWGVDPGEPRDPGVYKSPRLEADVALRGRDLDCTRLTAGLDDFSVKGALRLADWGRGRITFDLTGGALDADRFRAKPGKAAARAMKDGRCTDNSEPPRPLPLDLLRALNMHGALKMERLRFFGIRHRNLAATLDAAGGRLTLEPLSAGFYGGSMDAGLVVVVGPKALEMDLDLMADDFETGEFLQDQMDRDYVRGVSDVTLDFTARGATDEDLLNTLKGTAAFTVRNGSYRFLGGRQDPAKESRSKFSLARATFAAQNGRFEVTNFLLDSTLMRGTGGGYFDLAQNLIDLKLNAEYLAAPTVPILIRGCLTDPGVSVPGDKILENTVKEVISIPLKPFQYLQRLIF